jgi:uncharacterized membrane protein YgdD (TMEM256/DUF423 family)
MSTPTALDRVIEGVLSVGLLCSSALLAAGLFASRPGLLSAGIVLLMLTPLARVVVVTIDLLRQRDWAFAATSLWILGVLMFSLYVAWRLQAARL